MSAKQQLALMKLGRVVDKFKEAAYRDLVYFMRDLKAKNVFNFARSRLCEKIQKSKRFIEFKRQLGEKDGDELYDFSKREMEK